MYWLPMLHTDLAMYAMFILLAGNKILVVRLLWSLNLLCHPRISGEKQAPWIRGIKADEFRL